MGRIHYATALEVEAVTSGKRICDCCGEALATTRYDSDHLCGPCATQVKAHDARQARRHRSR